MITTETFPSTITRGEGPITILKNSKKFPNQLKLVRKEHAEIKK